LERAIRLIVKLIMCSFFLAVLPLTAASRENIDLTIHGEVLSARLRGIPLKIILEKLERERGTWFRGNTSFLDEAITVQFTDLTIEGGVNRILASMNYSLVFDRMEESIS